MSNKRPEILTDAGYEIYCDTVKLRELDVPVVDFKIDDLVWNFDLPLWDKDGTDDWNLTPREVINKIAGSTAHQNRVAQADLQYPILLTEKDGKWLIIDGAHRLVKAFEAGHTTIKAKLFTQEMIKKKPS
jgi:hypothetical protein